MCRVGVGWEPLDDIVKRLVDELARPGVTSGVLPIFSGAPESPSRPCGPLPGNKDFPGASDRAGAYLRSDADCERVSAVPRDFHAARHSAEAELKLEAGEAHGDTLTPANRHGPRMEMSATATIHVFVPRKGPAAEAAGQVSEGGENHGGGNVPVTLMLAAGQRGIRPRRKLR